MYILKCVGVFKMKFSSHQYVKSFEVTISKTWFRPYIKDPRILSHTSHLSL